MKKTLLTCFCSLGLLLAAAAQEPPAPPPAAPTPPPLEAATPLPTAAATATVSPAEDEAEDLERQIERKVRRGLSKEGALMAIPIVGIIFTTLFGAPVLIVAVIMFFSYIKARSLHKTVRMMVEKGQPVPEALFAAPHTPAKQRSDMRRGVVLVMIGLGVMLFFGAVSDWDGGAWAMGLIPFLIGAGYLAMWQLETGRFGSNKAGTDNPPPLP
jgi:hypothetical protein